MISSIREQYRTVMESLPPPSEVNLDTLLNTPKFQLLLQQKGIMRVSTPRIVVTRNNVLAQSIPQNKCSAATAHGCFCYYYENVNSAPWDAWLPMQKGSETSTLQNLPNTSKRFPCSFLFLPLPQKGSKEKIQIYRKSLTIWEKLLFSFKSPSCSWKAHIWTLVSWVSDMGVVLLIG